MRKKRSDEFVTVKVIGPLTPERIREILHDYGEIPPGSGKRIWPAPPGTREPANMEAEAANPARA